MEIRKTRPEEFETVLGIYVHGRQIMKRTGNVTQWGDFRPMPETVMKDIENGNSYVIVDDGEIHAVFAFLTGPDKTYEYIDGKWLNDNEYGVIHRIASDEKIRGVLENAVRYVSSFTDDIRIDTHKDNVIMRHLIAKLGFTECGIIITDDGTPRLAFQRHTEKEKTTMDIVSFESDYVNGAHPEILKKLFDTNEDIVTGYGEDKFCASAKEKIKKAVGKEDAEVYLLTGGTQTNVTVISTMLEPYEGCICAKTGHINGHESGALEFAGFKALQIPGHCGKIDVSELRDYCETFYADGAREHMVFPGMVYISHPTEYGTLYTKNELTEIYATCREFGMRLFVDGARLGYGLMSNNTDVSLNDLANLCDAFYIGGTKVGALCGEAVVFTHNNAPKHFINLIKKHCALLAKGRLLGVQFDALFTDDLYFRIGKYAVEKAENLKKVFEKHGYRFHIDSPTNQQFVIISNEKVKELSERIVFEIWEKYDDCHQVARFVTSWSTKDSDIELLDSLL